MNESAESSDNVRVAIRVRPQIPREKNDMCKVCVSVSASEAQVFLGSDKAFTFDHAFEMETEQSTVFSRTAKDLVIGCFDGYNATIFAYGQTGSGKTFTMGTGFDINVPQDEIGIIPRAVDELFNEISERKSSALRNGLPEPEFRVSVQFIELYNEEILDLLDTSRNLENKKSNIRLHEDCDGNIVVNGAVAQHVQNAQNNSTVDGATDCGAENGNTGSTAELECLSAKFHFVDLAGSERLKRTGATGDRAREGISINTELLALGNVIHALGDASKKASHVPYRDSKLTRLLQDSLGGNSRTLMIACISPSDCDFVETLSTLNYANRAKNIKNKVQVNQDKTSRVISALRAQIEALQVELSEFKQGKRVVGSDGAEVVSDTFHENVMLLAEVNEQRIRVKALQDTVNNLQKRNAELAAKCAAKGLSRTDGDGSEQSEIGELVSNYMEEIELLRTRLYESDGVVDALKKQIARVTPGRPAWSTPLSQTGLSPAFPHSITSSPALNGFHPVKFNLDDTEPEDILKTAKEDVEKLKIEEKNLAMKLNSDSGNGSESNEVNGIERGGGDDLARDFETGEDSLDSDESDSDDKETEERFDDEQKLADLQSNISVKEKLIDELERSNQRLTGVRIQYEEKLKELSRRIQETEQERDRILEKMKSCGSASADKVASIKSEYERKISAMQNDLKRLSAAQKQHTKLMQQNVKQEGRLRTLQNELSDLKKTKVQLMGKMKAEAEKARAAQAAKSQEVAVLKKAKRQQEITIQKLQNEKRTNEAMMKRKQDEIAAIRRIQRPVRGNYQVHRKAQEEILQKLSEQERRRTFSPKAAKSKFKFLEKHVTSLVNKRQTVAHMEIELERLYRARKETGRALEECMKRENALRNDFLSAKNDAAKSKIEEECRALKEEREGIESKICYLNDSITESQQNIMGVEETKESGGKSDPETLINQVKGIDEAKYLLTHIFTLCINQGMDLAQQSTEMKNLGFRIQNLQDEYRLQQELLNYCINQNAEGLEVQTDMTSSCESSSSHSNHGTLERRTSKARRRTAANPDELLYPENGLPSLPECSTTEKSGNKTREHSPCEKVSSKDMPPPNNMPPKLPPRPPPRLKPLTKQSSSTANMEQFGRERSFRRYNSQAVVKSELPTARAGLEPPSPHSQRRTLTRTETKSSPTFFRNSRSRKTAPATPSSGTSLISPDFQRNYATSSLEASGSSDLSTSMSSSTCSSVSGGNVFKRLTSTVGESPKQLSEEKRGFFKLFTTKDANIQSLPLQCLWIVEGHMRQVLSVHATPLLLASGGKDRYAKVWCLETKKELMTLGKHPSDVVSVKLSPDEKLLFTASFAEVQVYDLRSGKDCIKTLSSSGLHVDGSAYPEREIPRRLEYEKQESRVTDIALALPYLFMATESQVRIWDIREYKCVSKLNTERSGSFVQCLGASSLPQSLTRDPANNLELTNQSETIVATGSKDHSVSTFKIPLSKELPTLISKSQQLQPPHYDGIQCLTFWKNYLFSGSRNAQIKKWSMQNGVEEMSIGANAHREQLTSMAMLPQPYQFILATSCRGGMIKLWDAESLTSRGCVHGHGKTINQMASNDKFLFTAGGDQIIGVWKPKENLDSSL